jgi:DNA repair protein RecN (Recombination protein N)
MLTTLRIRNLALVAELGLELEPGYNVITGETGAGKSILIGALNLLLGERADRTLIRSGMDQCMVEGVFDVKGLGETFQEFLVQRGLERCEDGHLLIKRSLGANGTNKQFINGSPTTLNVLSAAGQFLVDIHGPHEHQSLLHPSRQLAILDAFGKLEPDRQAFADIVRRRTSLEVEKRALVVDEKTYAQQLDLLRFQVNEISAGRLHQDDEAAVETEYQRASNAAKLLQLAQAALDALAENENALLTQTGVVGRLLQELQRIDRSSDSLLVSHEQAVAALQDLQGGLSHYADKIDVDPGRLQELEERLNLLHSLKRKYGASLTDVIAFEKEARARLHALEQRDSELERLNAELRKLDGELWQCGQSLSSKRRKCIPRLEKAVALQLGDLGFKQSRLEARLQALSQDAVMEDPAGVNSTGFDTVEFEFAPNPGEPPRPLRAIASSGELARVMLALKTVLAAEDQIPVLVFDEVDANVGGETAKAVGEKMQQIAQNRQVLCITHLPQVAAPASAHYLASKKIKDGRTISEIRLLEKQERVLELQRMLGGESDAARRHAQAMLAPKTGK